MLNLWKKSDKGILLENTIAEALKENSDMLEDSVSCSVDDVNHVNKDVAIENLSLSENCSSLPKEVLEVVLNDKNNLECKQCEDFEPIEPVSEKIFQNIDGIIFRIYTVLSFC